MDHGSQPKSRLAALTFARELICLNRAGSLLSTTSQCQDPEVLIFCYNSIWQKIDRMLKPLVLKFRPDLSICLKDIAEKQVPARLKPVVNPRLFPHLATLASGIGRRGGGKGVLVRPPALGH